MELPELPEGHNAWDYAGATIVYSDTEMRAFGEACAQAAKDCPRGAQFVFGDAATTCNRPSLKRK
jgi:hypothetical protein